MKKGKLIVIGFGSLLLVIASMFLYITASGKVKEDINRGSHLSKEEKHELDNLMGQISRSLHDENYGFVLDHAVLPNENIEIIVKLGTEEVDEKTKKEIQKIATDVIKQNDFDSELFQFNVTSFNNSEKEGKRISQRLSYNDLMGDIMQTLSEKGFDIAVQGKVSSDQNVEIILVLAPDKLVGKTKKEVQKLAIDVIEKNNFDPEIFQFNITNYINAED